MVVAVIDGASRLVLIMRRPAVRGGAFVALPEAGHDGSLREGTIGDLTPGGLIGPGPSWRSLLPVALGGSAARGLAVVGDDEVCGTAARGARTGSARPVRQAARQRAGRAREDDDVERQLDHDNGA